jgi:hypothetical protein
MDRDIELIYQGDATQGQRPVKEGVDLEELLRAVTLDEHRQGVVQPGMNEARRRPAVLGDDLDLVDA